MMYDKEKMKNNIENKEISTFGDKEILEMCNVRCGAARTDGGILISIVPNVV
jgi:hypothetical protein